MVGLFFTNAHVRKMADEADAVLLAGTQIDKDLENTVRDVRMTQKETEQLGKLSSGFADRVLDMLEQYMKDENLELKEEKKGSIGGLIQSIFKSFKK